MNLESLAALATPAGALLLDSMPPYDPRLALTQSEVLRRRGFAPALVAAALTQSRLRGRAEAKLGELTRSVLLTDAGLQQATRIAVAAHHAQRIQSAGFHRIADVTCGIGIDAIAMAALGLTVVAAEIDPATAFAAAHNLRRFPSVQVIECDGLGLDLDALGVEAVFADPSRRTAAGRRVFEPAAYSPPLDALLALAQRRPIGVKVAPGIPHAALPAGVEAQWVSDGGTVVECGIWTGALGRVADETRKAARTALVLDGIGAAEVTQAPGARLETGTLGDYLLEPDGAVIRASLIAEAAAADGLVSPRLLHPRIAYVTADAIARPSPPEAPPAAPPADSPSLPAHRLGAGMRPANATASSTQLRQTPWAGRFFAAYRVLDTFPFKVATLRGYLKARGVGDLTVKKRGVDVDPDSLRRALGPRGEEAITVVLTRVEGRHSVIVVEPCESRAVHRNTEDVSP
ncbi:MAG: class I SAM-dependent methyltransferase [Bifidobacteriaceae bacterium]|nr:class I SAM-dependent methyltransferase [Bifidobacteriaceae bacterium]